MYCGHDTTSIIINNTFSRNFAYWDGHGACFESASPYLNSNIFWRDQGNEIYGFLSSNPAYNYNNIENFIAPGDSNVSVDPLFRDPDNGDFHLMATYCNDPYDSPCIDAGDPDIFDYILDCDFGLGGIRSDMGAYGGDNLGFPTDVDEEEVIVPKTLTVFQNYPNPFNAGTTIKFTLPEPGYASLAVYDILGRRVNTLLDEYLQSGNHAVIYDASRLSSGIYFARLETENETISVRMLLLR